MLRLSFRLSCSFPLHPVHVAIAAGLALVAAVLLTAVGMIIDLARPLLDWTNPQKAIKQNLNVLLAMFADAGILCGGLFRHPGFDQGWIWRESRFSACFLPH